MDIRLKLLSICLSLGFVIILFFLTKNKKLSEKNFLLWSVLCLIFIIFTLKIDIVISMSKYLGIINPNNMLFFFGIVFLMVICLYLSIKVSGLEDKLTKLAQENSLLREKIKSVIRGQG